MTLSRQIIEALRWKLIAEFMRRHGAAYTVIETHPCGGTYDCLTLLRGEFTAAHLNFGASFTACSPGGENRVESADLWSRALEEGGMRDVLDRMSQCCGHDIPAKLPPTNRETLAYRIMTGVASILAFEPESWEWRNGQEDTSGYGDQTYRDRWFQEFPGAEEDRQQKRVDDPFGLPAYRYWFLLRNEKPVVCLSKDAVLWARNQDACDLFEEYSRSRNIHTVAGQVLSALV